MMNKRTIEKIAVSLESILTSIRLDNEAEFSDYLDKYNLDDAILELVGIVWSADEADSIRLELFK